MQDQPPGESLNSGDSSALPRPAEVAVGGSRRVLLAAMGGACVPLSFDPWGLSFLMPLSIWCLAAALAGLDGRRGFWIGWVFGLAAEGLSFCWLATAVSRYTGIFLLGEPDSVLAVLAGIGAFLIWCPLAALGWACLGASVGAGPEKGPARWLWAVLGMGALESIWPRLFPWSMGSSFATSDPSAGWSLLSGCGVEGVSLLLVLAGFLAASGATAVPRCWRDGLRWLPLLLLMALPWIPLPTAGPAPETSREPLVVSIVQPAIELERRHGEAASAQQLELLRRLIEKAGEVQGPSVPLVILPEGILPGVWQESWLREWFEPWLGSPLIVGFTMAAEKGFSNAVAFLEPLDPEPGQPPTLDTIQLGQKKVLVPFGERVPLGGVLSSLGIDLPVPQLIPGEFQTVFQSDRFHEPLGVSICYEGILASAVAESIDLGARWHVNLTEDLWYGDGFEPEQHLQLQRSRAIENGLLWLRCANAGISAAIDPGIQGQRVVRSHRKWQDGNWSSWVESTDAGETRLSAVGERAILQLIIDTPGPPTGQAALSRAAHWTGLIWLLAVFWHFWHRREKRPSGA